MTPKDLNLAYKLRHALDESANALPAKTAERLAFARNTALSRKKQESTATVFIPQTARAGHTSQSPRNRLAWIGRMGLIVPFAALVFGLMGIYQFEQRQQVLESASIDAEVLTDDLPLSAYLDNGFDAFVAKAED